jgi:hypothetical protein
MNAGLKQKSVEEAQKAEQRQMELMKWRTGREAFVKRSRNCHHLVSTRAQPGIYRTPYHLASNTVPTVDGIPIEEHLRTLPSLQVCFRVG